ncbi:DUF6744 family protein [Pelotomaculum propionicicum]|uniref:Uncharacterized protein n=1 Tax=Pelotomaculum propionicicum TaxID=258475 RepID=A0A4Y7RJM0_9FIRM|nr:DUF6744 family protein [Pelotomaculum propionicicum]NLI11533.1 hypothetical protein [Peptococcaceae bacterium]TEB09184.1 hypothetical protein Pmgp_03316 [Pelotomaculum propionicicum]
MSFLAITPTGNVQLNNEALLGHLEFHTVPDLRIQKSDLASLWLKHNLPNEFLPGEIRPCDAFRRATASAQQTVTVNWNGGQYKARLMIREIKSNNEEITRALVREVIDGRNEVLDYATAGKLTFRRKNNSIHIQRDPYLHPEYNYYGILDRIERTYNEFINYHTRDTVRNLVNKVINSANPVNIIPRSQGKFIPKNNYYLLLGLKGLLEELRPYAKGECGMDLIPIVNTAEQRELVARRASIEIAGELDALVAELAEHLQKSGDNSLSTVQRLTSRAIELQERVREYEKLVNVRMNVLRAQLAEFISRVTPEESRQAI